jgi:hypothetical protein
MLNGVMFSVYLLCSVPAGDAPCAEFHSKMNMSGTIADCTDDAKQNLLDRSTIERPHLGAVMAGLVPAIHGFSREMPGDVDAWHKAGHDGMCD